MLNLYTVFIFVTTLFTSSMASANWHRVADDIVRASLDSNTNVEELAAFAAIESSFRPTVKNDQSTATGLFQFTNRTWRVTVQRYGHQYGIARTANRRAAYDNAVMGAEYLKENRRTLRNYLGREPTLTEVYMAHLLSPRRAAEIARAPWHQNVADMYPKLAAVNGRLFYREGRARNVAQFIGVLKAKIDKARSTYGPMAKEALVAYLDRQEERRRWQQELVLAMQSTCMPAVLTKPDVRLTPTSTMVHSTFKVHCKFQSKRDPLAPDWNLQDAVIRDRELAA
jgi:hypothetical protein